MLPLEDDDELDADDAADEELDDEEDTDEEFDEEEDVDDGMLLSDPLLPLVLVSQSLPISESNSLISKSCLL